MSCFSDKSRTKVGVCPRPPGWQREDAALPVLLSGGTFVSSPGAAGGSGLVCNWTGCCGMLREVSVWGGSRAPSCAVSHAELIPQTPPQQLEEPVSVTGPGLHVFSHSARLRSSSSTTSSSSISTSCQTFEDPGSHGNCCCGGFHSCLGSLWILTSQVCFAD